MATADEAAALAEWKRLFLEKVAGRRSIEVMIRNTPQRLSGDRNSSQRRSTTTSKSWAAWGSGSEKRKKNNQGYTLGSRSMLWFASPIVADSEVIVFQQEQPETADGAAAEPV